MKHFEIWMADLPDRENSSVQHGTRPVIIVSNDKANLYSPVVNIIPLTTRHKKPMPTHVTINGHGLKYISTALCEQVTALDKSNLIRYIGCIEDESVRHELYHALSIQFGMAA